MSASDSTRKRYEVTVKTKDLDTGQEHTTVIHHAEDYHFTATTSAPGGRHAGTDVAITLTGRPLREGELTGIWCSVFHDGFHA